MVHCCECFAVEAEREETHDLLTENNESVKVKHHKMFASSSF